MTLNEMIQDVTRILGDELGEQWNTDELKHILNFLHRQLLAEAGGGALSEIITLTQLVVPGQPSEAFYQFPERFLELKETGLRLEVSTGLTRTLWPYPFPSLQVGWEQRTGPPYWYLMGLGGDFRSVRLFPYPGPNNPPVNVTAYCKVSPKSLVELGSPAIPLAFHQGLVFMAVAEALERSADTRDFQAAQLWRGKGMAILAPYKRLAARKHDATPINVKGWAF
jgi:hypothetical protein